MPRQKQTDKQNNYSQWTGKKNKKMKPPNQMFADGGCSGDGEGDLQELEQHGTQPLQERHHLVQGENNHLVQGGKKSPGSR